MFNQGLFLVEKKEAAYTQHVYYNNHYRNISIFVCSCTNLLSLFWMSDVLNGVANECPEISI